MKREEIVKQIKDEAFEWSCDYKPWSMDMSPQQYAEYGYEIGAIRQFDKLESKIVELNAQIKRLNDVLEYKSGQPL